LKPQFRIAQRDSHWTVQVFYVTEDTGQGNLFDDWGGFEEPFNEPTYQLMKDWCYNNFKTWLKPKRARRMGYNDFWFQSKKDADWFILYWSGVDINMD
jgi:hypothetical protein